MSDLTATERSDIGTAIEASGGGASIQQLVYGHEPAFDLSWIDAPADARTLGGFEKGTRSLVGRSRFAEAVSFAATAPARVVMPSSLTARVTLKKPRVPAAASATIGRVLAAPVEPTFGQMRTLDPRHAMDAIRFVLRFMREDLPPPSVVPLGDGGLQLEWHRNDVDLEVTFTDEDDSGVYCRDLRSGSRWALPLDIAALERLEAVLERLSDRSQPR